MNPVIYTLIVTHITNMLVSIYLHRGISHKTLIFSPVFDHFARFWLWMTDGANIRDWVVTHRIHHKYTDVPGDPHSPHVSGIKCIAFDNFFLTCFYRYRTFFSDELTKKYAPDAANDWIERHVYQPYQRCGLLLMLVINVALFGFITGLIIWAVQFVWTPFWSNTVITGFCHWRIGYQHPKCWDKSLNIPFLGLFLIGDELHSNHHAEPYNPCLRHRWWEFDLSWCYIKLFAWLHLLKINYKNQRLTSSKKP